MDLFEKIADRPGPLGPFTSEHYGYMTFPKLEGLIGPEMKFQGKDMIVWSLNDYLGVASDPEVLRTDAEAAAKYGFSVPMGARLLTGNTDEHEALEDELAAFVHKKHAFLLNFGYQGVASVIQALMNRDDVLIYDSLSHACIVDGKQMAICEKFVFAHNDMDSLEKQLIRATKQAKPNTSILVVTEGVFGMTGDLGKLDEIIALKKKYNFRLLVDDAHGFGTMGHDGSGTGTHQGCNDGIDIYFGTFAKAIALIGAFVAVNDQKVNEFFKANVRSQIFAKSLPIVLAISARKRLKRISENLQWRDKLWANTNRIRKGLVELGFNVLPSESPVTPVLTHGSTDLAMDVMRTLREEHGIFVSGVAYPVVPKGIVLIRLIPTARHTDAHIDKTLKAFAALRETVLKPVPAVPS